MAEITKTIDINVPVDIVFDFVTNPHNTIKYSPQFTKFEPVSSIAQGLGAKVEAAGHYMGVTIKTTLEVTEYTINKRFVSRSTNGVKSISVWEFKQLSPELTEVTFTSDYTMPGKRLGWLLDKLMIEKEVEKTTIETLVNLKKILEKKPNLRPAQPAHW
jgi:uncharacterized membrane protein